MSKPGGTLSVYTGCEWPAVWQFGRVIATVVPVPGSLSIEISPPCSWTMFFVMTRPRPVPTSVCVVASGARKNGVNICSWTSFVIPMPSSRMVTEMPLLVLCVSRNMLLFSGEYFVALLRTLLTNWATRVRAAQRMIWVADRSRMIS